MARVLVCGSREWTDTGAIRAELAALPPGSMVIHGDNGYDAEGHPLWGQPDALAVRGADKLAGAITRELGLAVEVYLPDWKTHGRGAGPKRNQRMLEEGKPDQSLAFTHNLAGSRGTADMVRRLRAAGVPVRMVDETSE